MKTVEEEAVFLSNKNVLSNINWNDTSELERLKAKYYDGFKAGAEFAQRWISVEDELPEYHGIDFYVLMKNERLDSDDINLGLIEGIDDVENVYQYATHWRPIELK